MRDILNKLLTVAAIGLVLLVLFLGLSIVNAYVVLAADALESFTCDLVHVSDGDTVQVICPAWPSPVRKQGLRIFGIDTPESIRGRAKCIKELRLGLDAKAWAKRQFETAKTVTFIWAGTIDKFGGRLDAYVFLPNGDDWATEAIRIGKARAYGRDGNLKKLSWCK
jgi:endonuclease YncB( thermonuclease family)